MSTPTIFSATPLFGRIGRCSWAMRAAGGAAARGAVLSRQPAPGPRARSPTAPGGPADAPGRGPARARAWRAKTRARGRADRAYRRRPDRARRRHRHVVARGPAVRRPRAGDRRQPARLAGPARGAARRGRPPGWSPATARSSVAWPAAAVRSSATSRRLRDEVRALLAAGGSLEQATATVGLRPSATGGGCSTTTIRATSPRPTPNWSGNSPAPGPGARPPAPASIARGSSARPGPGPIRAPSVGAAGRC